MPNWLEELNRPKVVSIQDPVGKTEKSHRIPCNINTIVNKYRKTGLAPQRGTPGFYGDFTNITDYQTAANQIKIAEESFMHLPAKVRKEFDNDPSKLLAFIENDDNYEKAVELGILPKPDPVVEEVPSESSEPAV